MVELCVYILANTKFHLRYLVGSETLVFLVGIRGDILRRNRTTWANTDTRLDTIEFRKQNIGRGIAIRALGGS